MKILFAFTTGVFAGVFGITWIYLTCTNDAGHSMGDFVRTVFGE